MDRRVVENQPSNPKRRTPKYKPIRHSSFLVRHSIFIFLSLPSLAQTGGQHTFDFLNLTPSTPITAAGGVHAAAPADSGAVNDVHRFLSNPALNNEHLNQQVSLSFRPYLADVKLATVSYSHAVENGGQLGASVSYLDYGEFVGFDPAGLPTGDFSASSYSVALNYAHQMAPFRLGGNLKLASSMIAGLRATALLLDAGGVYQHPTRDLAVGLTITNLGVLISDYVSGADSRLPSDVRVGVAFKPQYMPFRFHLTAYRLWYSNLTEPTASPDEGVVSRIARHLTFGGALLLGKNFEVYGGYNHSIRSSLQLQQIGGGAGLSFGFMFRTRTIRVDFSRSLYHVSGAFNQFSLSTDVHQLFFK